MPRRGRPGGRVAVDREDRVGHGDGGALVGAQCLAHRVRVGVRDDLGRTAGQPAAVDEGGVVARVGDDQRAVRREGGDGGEVGRVTGGEDQRGLEAAEVGQFAFEFAVQLGGAGDEPRPGGAAAPGPRGRFGARHDLGMTGQAQVVVAREIEQRRVGRAWPQGPYESGPPARRRLLVDPAERHGVLRGFCRQRTDPSGSKRYPRCGNTHTSKRVSCSIPTLAGSGSVGQDRLSWTC